MSKIIISGADARKKIVDGTNQIANAVTTTLGPLGRNVGLAKVWVDPVVVHDGVSVAKEISLEDKGEDFAAQLIRQAASKTNDKSGDGPQDLNSLILTPTGFVKMGDMEVGMDIAGTYGTTQKVMGVFPKGSREIWEVHLSGDRKMKCSPDHRFTVTTSSGSIQIPTLRQLADDYKKTNVDGSTTHKYFIHTTPVEFIEDKDAMPVHPYLLGVLLGDGSLSGSGRSTIEIALGKAKEHILQQLILPEGIEMRSTWIDSKNYFRVKLTGKNAKGQTIRAILDSIGLLGTTSKTKFIPEVYLYSSLKSRQQLLQGLLDTDGYINKRDLFEYSTVSEKLLNGFVNLSRSLGKTISFRTKDRSKAGGYSTTDLYVVSQRKGYKYGNKIEAIIPTGKHVEMQCIKVSNADHLYVTDDYIFTHNTTTTTLLAQALVNDGMDLVASGKNPMSLKRGMEFARDIVVKEIEEATLPVETKEKIQQVATISAQDEEMGRIIAEAIWKVGKSGSVDVEESSKYGIDYEIKEGMEFEKGLTSPQFANTDKGTVELKNPYILILDHAVQSAEKLIGFLGKLLEVTKDPFSILILADNIDKHSLESLLTNKKNGSMFSVFVQSPGFAERRKEYLQDIAVLTDATVVAMELGKNLDNITVDVLGRAEKVMVDSKTTKIIGGLGKNAKIKGRITQIEAKIEEADSDFDKKIHKERIAKLTSGCAVMKVGGVTEVEMKDSKERVIDAVEATKAAFIDGIVYGGGKLLLEISRKLMETDCSHLKPQEQDGYFLVQKALKRPFDKLMDNAGIEDIQKLSIGQGIDVHTGKAIDLLEAGIIDPSAVVINSIRNAISVASMLITTDVIIADREDIEVRQGKLV